MDQSEIAYSAQWVCGQALGGLGDLEAAERAFRLAAAVPVARRSQALGSLSELLRGRGERARALAVLEEALALEPRQPQHLFNLGSLHLEQGALDEAAGFFHRVLEVSPDSLSARLNLGFIAKTQGRPEEAERIYGEAMALDPSGVEARANLAHLLLDQERQAEAAALLREVRARRPGLIDIDLGLLAAGGFAADWPAARALLEAVLTAVAEVSWTPAELAAPEPAARVLVRLSAALLRQNQSRCAELAMAGAVSLDPGYPDARRGLAEFFLARGALWKAVAQFEALITRDPGDQAAFKRLGDCYQRLGAADAARLCYSRAGAAETMPGLERP
jgi:tetratricopeptide (TPR) repeat protein